MASTVPLARDLAATPLHHKIHEIVPELYIRPLSADIRSRMVLDFDRIIMRCIDEYRLERKIWRRLMRSKSNTILERMSALSGRM